MLLNPAPANAQINGGSVVGVLGRASAKMPDQSSVALRPGMKLPAGATIYTGSKSALDLDLGEVVGVIRLTENTVLTVEKVVNTEPAAQAAMSIQLRLAAGTLLGNSHAVPTTAVYEVSVTNGIVGVVQGQYRIHAQGFVVLLDGTAVVVPYVAKGEEPKPYTLKAPPAVYFSPFEGIRPAPPALIKEIRNQTRGKLPRH